MSQIKISQEQANVTLKGTNTNTTTALWKELTPILQQPYTILTNIIKHMQLW